MLNYYKFNIKLMEKPMTITETPLLSTGTWSIDPVHSEIGFAVRHLGLSKIRGRFNSFTGGVTVDNTLDDSTIEVDIDLASVDTNNEQRDGHLHGTHFFDVESSPRMTFRSTSINEAEGVIRGELTINGTTREVDLNTEFHGVAVDAYSTTRAGFSANATIRRSDFGIDFNVPLDAGGVLIGDKVGVELEIQLVAA